MEVAGNEGHKQAGKADHTVVPLRHNPLAIGSVTSLPVQPVQPINTCQNLALDGSNIYTRVMNLTGWTGRVRQVI